MTPSQHMTFLNTGLPVMVLALAAWFVPLLLGRRARGQRALARAILTSALIVLVLGALIFAAIYQAAGVAVLPALLDAPTAVAGFFARAALLAGIVWGPVLALAWYMLAQDVERRRGAEMAQGGR